ncbi:MAG: alpha-amylase [Lachnospiraceae bacterium]|nr:alpha-amylase [Lachnospiraceae bacterium]
MKKRWISLWCIMSMILSLTGCNAKTGSLTANVPDDKYRTFYEVFVYSFYDGNGDGIGDLEGLTRKLDYINDGNAKTTDDLGCNGIWLMPIMPATTYHKYDVTDYMAIDPQYGTMEDFETFMAACKERDIHVLIDLVINHTSSKHKWFVEASNYLASIGEGEPDVSECPYVDYYHFSKEVSGGAWYQVPGASGWYYEAPFWSGMPDLNLESEAVRKEIADITRFWLDKGVAGFRLDAVKEYVTGSVESNVEILTWLNDTVKAQNPDCYVVAEVWEPESTYAMYYASGIDSCFNFRFANQTGTIASVLNRKGSADASSYGSAIAQLPDTYSRYGSQWIDAPFYTNHDMGRSAGYYAGEGSEEKTKMAQAMNLLMGGNVFLYYGEELGMKGSGIDENKRAPMYWSEDKTAEGMCRGPLDMENVQMKFPSLEVQQADEKSVYNYVKQVIGIRNAFPAIARGEVTFLENVSDENVCVLKKTYKEEEILLIYNISGEMQVLDGTALGMGEKNLSRCKPAAALYTGEEKYEKSGSEIRLPAYSVLVYAK